MVGKYTPSGVFNGDRWSMVLLVHSSWATTTPDMRSKLISLGMPCPPSGPSCSAAPAIGGSLAAEAGLPPGDDALIDLSDEAPAAEAGVSSEVVKDPLPKGTLEEAQSRAHQMTHLPKNPFCDVCSKAEMQRKQKHDGNRPSLSPTTTHVRLLPSSGNKSLAITS